MPHIKIELREKTADSESFTLVDTRQIEVAGNPECSELEKILIEIAVQELAKEDVIEESVEELAKLGYSAGVEKNSESDELVCHIQLGKPMEEIPRRFRLHNLAARLREEMAQAKKGWIAPLPNGSSLPTIAEMKAAFVAGLSGPLAFEASRLRAELLKNNSTVERDKFPIVDLNQPINAQDTLLQLAIKTEVKADSTYTVDDIERARAEYVSILLSQPSLHSSLEALTPPLMSAITLRRAFVVKAFMDEKGIPQLSTSLPSKQEFANKFTFQALRIFLDSNKQSTASQQVSFNILQSLMSQSGDQQDFSQSIGFNPTTAKLLLNTIFDHFLVEQPAVTSDSSSQHFFARHQREIVELADRLLMAVLSRELARTGNSPTPNTTVIKYYTKLFRHAVEKNQFALAEKIRGKLDTVALGWPSSPVLVAIIEKLFKKRAEDPTLNEASALLLQNLVKSLCQRIDNVDHIKRKQKKTPGFLEQLEDYHTTLEPGGPKKALGQLITAAKAAPAAPPAAPPTEPPQSGAPAPPLASSSLGRGPAPSLSRSAAAPANSGFFHFPEASAVAGSRPEQKTPTAAKEGKKAAVPENQQLSPHAFLKVDPEISSNATPASFSLSNEKIFQRFTNYLAYCGVAAIGFGLAGHLPTAAASLANASRTSLLVGVTMILAAGVIALILAAKRYYAERPEVKRYHQKCVAAGRLVHGGGTRADAGSKPFTLTASFWSSVTVGTVATGATITGVTMLAATNNMELLQVGMLLAVAGATILVGKFVLEGILHKNEEPAEKPSCWSGAFGRGMYWLMLAGVTATAVTAGVLLGMQSVAWVNIPTNIASPLSTTLLAAAAFTAIVSLCAMVNDATKSTSLKQNCFNTH